MGGAGTLPAVAYGCTRRLPGCAAAPPAAPARGGPGGRGEGTQAPVCHMPRALRHVPPGSWSIVPLRCEELAWLCGRLVVGAVALAFVGWVCWALARQRTPGRTLRPGRPGGRGSHQSSGPLCGCGGACVRACVRSSRAGPGGRGCGWRRSLPGPTGERARAAAGTLLALPVASGGLPAQPCRRMHASGLLLHAPCPRHAPPLPSPTPLRPSSAPKSEPTRLRSVPRHPIPAT